MKDIIESTCTRVVQVNTNHIRGAVAELDLGIMLMQESWIYSGQVMGLSNKEGKLTWDNRYDNPRACLMIRININFMGKH